MREAFLNTVCYKYSVPLFCIALSITSFVFSSFVEEQSIILGGISMGFLQLIIAALNFMVEYNRVDESDEARAIADYTKWYNARTEK